MDASTRSVASVALVTFVVCTGLSACSASNNPVLGRVEANVSGHQVVVINCYTMHVHDVRPNDGGELFAPCKDAAVTIKDDSLFVNGESYGQLAPGDRVLVDHGKTTIEPQ